MGWCIKDILITVLKTLKHEGKRGGGVTHYPKLHDVIYG